MPSPQADNEEVNTSQLRPETPTSPTSSTRYTTTSDLTRRSRGGSARRRRLRVYFSTWPLTGGHANRPPLLQPEPDLRGPDVVGVLAALFIRSAVTAQCSGSCRREQSSVH